MRGYQNQVTDQAIEKVGHMDRQRLFSYKPNPTANKAVTPIVMAYHPDLQKVRGNVDKHWPIIESSKALSKVFPEKQPAKNISDFLVRPRIKPDPIDDEPLCESNPVAEQEETPAK